MEDDAAKFTASAIEGEIAGDQDKAQKDYEKAARESKLRTKLDSSTVNFIKMDGRRKEQAFKDGVKLRKDIDEANKKALLYKIQKYFDRFPFLESKIPKPNPKGSIIEIEETLTSIRLEMDSQNSIQTVMSYWKYGLVFTESIVQDGSQLTFLPEKYRLNLTGLTKMTERGLFNDDVLPVLLEIDTEYPWIGQSGLVRRAATAFFGVLFKVHMLNTNPAAMALLKLDAQGPIKLDTTGM